MFAHTSQPPHPSAEGDEAFECWSTVSNISPVDSATHRRAINQQMQLAAEQAPAAKKPWYSFGRK